MTKSFGPGWPSPRKFLMLSLLALLVSVSPAIGAKSCSCVASDGTCDASVTCPDGCYAVCGSGGNCGSGCSAGGGGSEHLTSGAAETPELVTLHANEVSADDLSFMLSNHLGQRVRFVANKANEVFSISVDGMPVGEWIQVLSRYGAVTKFEKESSGIGADLPSANITVKLENADANAINSLLQNMFPAHDIQFKANKGQTSIALDVQDIPLEQFLRVLSQFGAVEVN